MICNHLEHCTDFIVLHSSQLEWILIMEIEDSTCPGTRHNVVLTSDDIVYLTFETVLSAPLQLDSYDSIPPPDLSELGSPYDWSPKRKSFITYVSCISTLFLCVGSLMAMTISIVQEKMAIRRRKHWNSVLEGRVYFSCLEGTLLPPGLFLFGWTSQF